jgi:hypothetical protein
VIVRISGLGQFELDDNGGQRMQELDTELTEALHAGNEPRFHELLRSTVSFIRETGKEVPHDTVVPSNVIVPPEDISMSEAQDFFTDERHMQPLLA